LKKETYVKDRCYHPSCQTTNRPTVTDIDQFWAPRRVSLRSEGKDGGIIHAITVEITPTVTDELAGACDGILGDLVGVGGAIAGAVNAWLGVGFALASLACIA
jgi:hypothetical protein